MYIGYNARVRPCFPVSGLPVWLSIVLIGVICLIYTSLVSLYVLFRMFMVWSGIYVAYSNVPKDRKLKQAACDQHKRYSQLNPGHTGTISCYNSY